MIMNTKNKIEEYFIINLQQCLLRRCFPLSDKTKLSKRSRDKIKMSVYLRNTLIKAKMLMHWLIPIRRMYSRIMERILVRVI